MTIDHYCVMGNPISHSRSPWIHTRFAELTGQKLHYDRREIPLDHFDRSIETFIREGGLGCNITVPFKFEAAKLATRTSERGLLAQACNTLSFKDGAYNELDAANTATAVTGLAPLVITVDANQVSSSWLDVRFSTVGGVALDAASFADAARELALSGSGLGGLAGLLQLAPTQLSSSNDGIDNNGNGIVDEADENVWRFYVSRGFVEGSVAVTLTGANWSDMSGNHGQDAVQAFQVISTLKPDNGQGGQTVGKVFYIEISGGIKLQGLGFTDEPIIDIRGGVTLEISKVLQNGNLIDRFSIDANGTIKIIKLGNIGSAGARFVLQTGATVSGSPEFWGVVKIQANLDFLKNYGIYVEGSALLQINTTATAKTEKIALEGIVGDVLQANLAISTATLSSAVLGETALPTSWNLGLLDINPELAGVQSMNVDGALVRTIVQGQQWKIITRSATDPTKFGPSYFITAGKTAGSYDLRSEAQTFVLAAESFSIEIVGSLKIKVQDTGTVASRNANGFAADGDDYARLFGGFYLRITPTRLEIFVQAQAEVPSLTLNGEAVGLIIIDASTTAPGLPGLAMMISLKLNLGGATSSPSGGDQTSALTGVFELRGSVVIMLNTTLREQVFEIPQSFLTLLPADSPSTVTVFAAAPNIDGSKSASGPNFYISANIQGSIKLYDTITLSGFISFTAAVDPSGSAYVHIVAAVSTNIQFIGAMSGSLDLSFYTDRNGDGPGIVGRVQLARSGGGGIPGVGINGQFMLEVNSYTSAITIKTLVNNLENAGAGSGGAGRDYILAVDVAGLFILKDVAINPGLHLVMQGELTIGSAVKISGRFEFLFSTNPVALEIRANAQMSLFGIGVFHIDGALRVDADGVAAYLNVDVGGSFGAQIGLSFNAGATVELYVGSQQQKVLTLADGSQVTVLAGFKLNIHGSVSFMNLASASGSITITLRSNVFSIEFDVAFSLGPITLAARGGAAIYADGLVLVLDVSVDANMFEVIKIKASGK